MERGKPPPRRVPLPDFEQFRAAWQSDFAARWSELEAAVDRYRRRVPASWDDMPLPTLGGRQVWADRLVFAGWRIQENVLTGECRLLDPRDLRLCTGDFARCLRRFHAVKRLKRLHHAQPHLVVLVHGLLRSKAMFVFLKRRLERAGYAVLAFTYPSTRLSVADHARHLSEVMSHLTDVKEITFVTHSMGALVVRAALAAAAPWRKKIAVKGLFMMAPPNRGALWAGMTLEKGPLLWLTAGVAADLMPDALKLGPPEVRYAVVAGGTGQPFGFNPLLPGDNDGFVTVAETRLADDDDFLLVQAPHGLVDDHPRTTAALLRFLDGGRAAA